MNKINERKDEKILFIDTINCSVNNINIQMRLPNTITCIITHKAFNLIKIPTLRNKFRPNNQQQPIKSICHLRYNIDKKYKE